MSTVLVSPGDVVSTGVGVLHVQSVIVERSREGESLAVSGVGGDGVVHSNIPIAEGVVPLGVDVSESEALVWFDRERYLKRLSAAVFEPGDSAMALGRFAYPEGVGVLSLSDCEPVEAVVGWLGEVEASLVEASAWVEGKRAECLRAFEGFHAGWLKYQNHCWVEPELGGCRNVGAGVEVRVGGIYQFRREGAPVEGGYEYFKVVSSDYNPEIILYGASTRALGRPGVIDCSFGDYTALPVDSGNESFWICADTVKLLPIGSFKDIGSYLELSEYDVSLPEALRDIFLDMFSAGDGKPVCLPIREELDDDRYCWADDYAKCRGRLMDVTANMLFDIEKSVGYVRWLREQLVGFYRDELGFDM